MSANFIAKVKKNPIWGYGLPVSEFRFLDGDGHLRENEDRKGVCELCGKRNLRWEFWIEHSSGPGGWVGSDCIKIYVGEDDYLLATLALADFKRVKKERAAAEAAAERARMEEEYAQWRLNAYLQAEPVLAQIAQTYPLQDYRPIYRSKLCLPQLLISWIWAKFAEHGWTRPVDVLVRSE